MLSQAELIAQLDLGYLATRLVDQEGWSPEHVEEAVRRYKNFLVLLGKHPHELLAPAPDIDEIWHAHILHTEEYTRDCEAIFGAYVHHRPARLWDPNEKSRMQQAHERTAELYLQEFHELYPLELDVSSLW